jgi:hypothetical protein
MREAIPPLPHTPSWRGAQLNQSDNFYLQRRDLRPKQVCSASSPKTDGRGRKGRKGGERERGENFSRARARIGPQRQSGKREKNYESTPQFQSDCSGNNKEPDKWERAHICRNTELYSAWQGPSYLQLPLLLRYLPSAPPRIKASFGSWGPHLNYFKVCIAFARAVIAQSV